MSELVILDSETKNVQKVSFAEDTDLYQELKITSQKFLEVNNFKFDGEPKFNKFSNKEFISYIEKKTEKDNNIVNMMKKVKIPIDFRSSMSNVYPHKKYANHNILVFFQPQTKTKGAKIGVDIIKNFIGLMFMLDCVEGLFISTKNLSPKSLDSINSNNKGGEENIYNITNYTDDEFINIIEHSFVPKVLDIIRTKEEVEEFSIKENINLSILPRLQSDDKLVKFYRGKPGDIFKLERKITTGNLMINTQLVYRMVV